MIVVIGRVRCQPEERAGLEDLLATMQERSRQEDGCVSYGFYQSIEDEAQYVAVEEWESQEALDRHFKEPHLAEFSSGLARTVASPPTIDFYEVVPASPPGS